MQKDNSTAAFNINPLELADIIYTSSLPQGKKLAYLYMLADGSFSLSHFDGLLLEFESAGKPLKLKKEKEESKLKSLVAKKEKLEEELVELQIKSADEQLMNFEKLTVAIENEVENEKETAKLKKIKSIKTKLNKKK